MAASRPKSIWLFSSACTKLYNNGCSQGIHFYNKGMIQTQVSLRDKCNEKEKTVLLLWFVFPPQHTGCFSFHFEAITHQPGHGNDYAKDWVCNLHTHAFSVFHFACGPSKDPIDPSTSLDGTCLWIAQWASLTGMLACLLNPWRKILINTIRLQHCQWCTIIYQCTMIIIIMAMELTVLIAYAIKNYLWKRNIDPLCWHHICTIGGWNIYLSSPGKVHATYWSNASWGKYFLSLYCPLQCNY